MVGSNYFLGNKVTHTGGGRMGASVGGSNPSTIYGKVVKVVLDYTEEVFDRQTGDRVPPGAILYTNAALSNTATDPVKEVENSHMALPYKAHFKQIPQVGELVELVQGISPKSQDNKNRRVMYYKEPLNIWGAINHNALPDLGADYSTPIGSVEEITDINPLYPFPGDLLIEGRQGQSVRIGGYKSPENKLVDKGNNKKPYILISNGQIKTDNGIDSIVEDINLDPNSMYFLSDHTAPLKAANSKRDTYNVIPTTSDQYRGNQVILSGGRLYFNAKEESAFISAKNSIGLNAETVNIDAQQYMCLDADRIYLGQKARTAITPEPAVLGKQLIDLLGRIAEALTDIGTAFATAVVPSTDPLKPPLPIESIASAAALISLSASSIKQSLGTETSNILSKKVFIE